MNRAHSLAVMTAVAVVAAVQKVRAARLWERDRERRIIYLYVVWEAIVRLCNEIQAEQNPIREFF